MDPPASRRAGPAAAWVFFLLALGPVAAMETFTPGALEALNGTDVRLKCTFRSSVPVGPKLTVSWYFQSELKEPLEAVLHYHGWAYPSKSGHFLGRITWDGNVHKDDASVMLHNVSPKDNGTFQCHVKNPSDVDGVIGEIRLRVVLKRSFSEMHILLLTIGLSCAAMVVLVVVVVIWRHWRRMQQDKAREVGRPEQLKLKEGGEEKETTLLGQETLQSWWSQSWAAKLRPRQQSSVECKGTRQAASVSCAGLALPSPPREGRSFPCSCSRGLSGQQGTSARLCPPLRVSSAVTGEGRPASPSGSLRSVAFRPDPLQIGRSPPALPRGRPAGLPEGRAGGAPASRACLFRLLRRAGRAGAAGPGEMGPERKKAGVAAALPLLLLAVARVHLLEIQAAAQVRAFVGEAVTLKCWFKSSAPVSEKLTVDWTYRPLAGGNLEPVLHYQSSAYPARRGTFRDRVSWAGDVAQQDASIVIWSPTLEDNGTFSCSVKNPPDVQHNIPHTLLTVSQRGASFQLTSSGLLSILVFLPSGLVVVLLLVRLNQKSGLMKARRQLGYKKSSIEVSEEPERSGCRERLASCCLQCLDTDEEEPY